MMSALGVESLRLGRSARNGRSCRSSADTLRDEPPGRISSSQSLIFRRPGEDRRSKASVALPASHRNRHSRRAAPWRVGRLPAAWRRRCVLRGHLRVRHQRGCWPASLTAFWQSNTAVACGGSGPRSRSRTFPAGQRLFPLDGVGACASRRLGCGFPLDRCRRGVRWGDRNQLLAHGWAPLPVGF
jgi:hypothetical protein